MPATVPYYVESMNLIRLIAIAVLFWLLYRLILTLLSKAGGSAPRHAPSVEANTMVRCQECGLHVPKCEALEKEGKYYCCEEHRDATDSRKREE